MYVIRPATKADAALLSRLATDTFHESHGHSASPQDIEAYADRNYTVAAMEAELENASNLYHLLLEDGVAAGFSKIVLNVPCPGVTDAPLAKLERLYLLKQFYDKHLGTVLFDYLLQLAKDEGQAGIWLYVWTENARALRFYRKQGFAEVGRHDFPISPTHSNPNYRMLLRF